MRVLGLLTVLGLFAGGCQPPLHVTSAVPTPLMERGGEVQLNGALSGDGVHGSLVASPVAPLSLFLLGDVEPDEGEHSRSRYEGGGGLGVFVPLGGNWRGEVLGGMTVGHVETRGSTITLQASQRVGAEADVRRTFIQGNVGRSIGRRGLDGAGGFGVRLERVAYTDYLRFRNGTPQGDRRDVDAVFVMPTLFGSLGNETIRGTYTLSYGIPLQDLPFDIDGVRTSFGVQVRLDRVLNLHLR